MELFYMNNMESVLHIINGFQLQLAPIGGRKEMPYLTARRRLKYSLSCFDLGIGFRFKPLDFGEGTSL